MHPYNRTLVFGLFIVLVAATIFYLGRCSKQPDVQPTKEPDLSHYFKAQDSLNDIKNKAQDSINLENIKIAVNVAVKKSNHAQLDKDIYNVSLYSDLNKLLDSLYSARQY